MLPTFNPLNSVDDVYDRVVAFVKNLVLVILLGPVRLLLESSTNALLAEAVPAVILLKYWACVLVNSVPFIFREPPKNEVPAATYNAYALVIVMLVLAVGAPAM
jgi:hypothetical protein